MTKAFPTQAMSRYELLRVRAWPILQTAVAAVAAWYLPAAAYGVEAGVCVDRGGGRARSDLRPASGRAIELIGGVVLGVGVADLLVSGIGSGGWQLGVLVVLAMAAAVVLGGGPVLVTEAAVLAILLVLLEPLGSGFPPTRVIEALIGGGVALAVSALAFPPNPVLLVGRSAQAIIGGLGRTLEEVAGALADRDGERSAAALRGARGLDQSVRELDEALVLGRETARFSPGWRSSRGELERYAAGARHMDYAVRNTRVLARHVQRFLRGGGEAPQQLAEAIQARTCRLGARRGDRGLGAAGGRGSEPRLAGGRARRESYEADRTLGLAEIVAQVRSTAIDLVRAVEAAVSPDEPAGEPATEELLLGLAPPRDRVEA